MQEITYVFFLEVYFKICSIQEILGNTLECQALISREWKLQEVTCFSHLWSFR